MINFYYLFFRISVVFYMENNLFKPKSEFVFFPPMGRVGSTSTNSSNIEILAKLRHPNMS